ncbi:hypothetical protein [Cellulomonas sp. URHE0023]|uniref:hypothetical protein n=1 Tax=Cellulomonas sp. URHE0023 TaxID=1380354 RepID=UPI00048734B9|nr:hypothetical protein [Cellulomonas sp. URHE0023]
MSTSDPNRPADDTTPSADAATAPVDPVVADTPEPVAPAAPAPEAAATTPAGQAVVEPPTEAQPAAVEPPTEVQPAVAKPVEPSESAATAPAAEPPAHAGPASLDTGRHAIVRPAPVPPEDPVPVVSTPATTPVTAVETRPQAPTEPAVTAAGAATVASRPETEPAVPYGAITPEPEDDGRLFPDPNAPSSPSAGSRVLGILVGLVLAPISLLVLLLGESQILEAQVDTWDATTSVFGIVLVTLGLLLLGCVLLLGSWTAAVPITGGAVLTAAGVVYLYAPSIAREQTLRYLSSSGWRTTITQVTVAGTSGMVLAVGFLLLLAGLVIASARRRGVHLGEFRERHKV